MPSFGYASGDGSGTNTQITFLLNSFIATTYVNDTGVDLLVDQIDILQVNHVTTLGTPTYQALIYSAPGYIARDLMGSSNTSATLVAGTNSFTFSTPVLVRTGEVVGIVFRANLALVYFDGAIATRRASYNEFGHTNPWVIDAVSDRILPATVTGTAAPAGGTNELRLANLVAEPLSEGESDLRLANLLVEPLSEGVSTLRLAELIAEPLSEGTSTLRLAKFVVEVLQPVPLEREMATDIFPTLRGLGYTVGKSPTFNTSDRQSPNLKSVRNAFAQHAAWDFKLEFEFLEDDQGNPNVALGTTDYRYLTGFFIQQRGKYGDWLFKDPDDYIVTLNNMQRYTDGLTAGDGVTTEFWFARTMGPAIEPIGQVDVAATYQIYVAGVLQTAGVNYTFNAPNRVTFAVAPAAVATVKWTGQFYFVCHFLEDAADFEKFVDKLWELGELTFRGEPQ